VNEIPYSISAPARRASRVLMDNFDIFEREDSEASEHNIATMIDAYTQAFRMKNAIKYMEDIGVCWLDDPDNGKFLDERIDELRAFAHEIDEFRRSLPRFADESAEKLQSIGLDNRFTNEEREVMRKRARKMEVNPLALHAARMLMDNYDFVERIGGQIRSNERNIALVIGFATRIERLQSDFHLMCSKVIPMSEDEIRRDLMAMNRTVDMLDLRVDPRIVNVRGALRRVDLAHNYMPAYHEQKRNNVQMGRKWARDKYEPTDQEKRRAAQLRDILERTKRTGDVERIRRMLAEVA
jgi:hypothetical protein